MASKAPASEAPTESRTIMVVGLKQESAADGNEKS